MTPRNDTDEIGAFVEQTEQPLKKEYIYDIPITFSVELGRRRMTISELMEMQEGKLIQLDNAFNDDLLCIYANGHLIARGQPVATDGRHGIRIMEIISASDRMSYLR